VKLFALVEAGISTIWGIPIPRWITSGVDRVGRGVARRTLAGIIRLLRSWLIGWGRRRRGSGRGPFRATGLGVGRMTCDPRTGNAKENIVASMNIFEVFMAFPFGGSASP
jgi:hypothetical protein